jgi:O-antigen ligase
MFLVSSIDFGNNSSAVDDSWERFALWESAMRATPSILWGAGTGDSKLLNEYYLTHNLTQFAEGSYNAHNQFIQIFFINGILGLLAVLILIIRPLYLSVKRQNALGILVFFPFLIYSMTEVFLGRYQGVVFFALLHQCFIAYYQSEARSLILKTS